MSSKWVLLVLAACCATVKARIPTGCSNSSEAPATENSSTKNVPIIDTNSQTSVIEDIGSPIGSDSFSILSLCPAVVRACSSPPQDNWFFYNIPPMTSTTRLRINTVHVLINFTLNCSDMSCSEAFGLYFSNFNGDNLMDFSAYTEVPNAPMPGVAHPITVTNAESLGVSLRDNGTCVTIHRWQIYYSVCVVGFAMTNSEIPFGSSDVSVTCVANSEQSSVTISCSDTGQLSPSNPCQCRAGYSGTDGMNCTACQMGRFKSETGNGDCMDCPDFSEALTTASTECVCMKGHRRANPGDPTTPCDQCVAGYFMSSSQCETCPMGSNSTGGTVSTCTCDSGLATSSESTTTITDVCDRCRANHIRINSMCMTCPQMSRRGFVPDDSACMCEAGRVTTSGNTTTTMDDCTECALSRYPNGGGCSECPDNSMRLRLSDSSCTCVMGRATQSGALTTTSGPCSGCRSTHYVNGGMCSACPVESFSASPSAETCTCNQGYRRPSGLVESATEECEVILGFTVSQVTVDEGDTVMVTIRAGADTSVTVSLASSANSLVPMMSSVMFDNSNEVTVTLAVQDNDLAFSSRTPVTVSILMNPSQYVIGGSFGGTVVYGSLNVSVREDDDVIVGFTASSVSFNETDGSGMVTVKRIGDISSPLILTVDLTSSGVITLTNSMIQFSTSTSQRTDEVQVPFTIIDDNSGGNAIRPVRLSLTLAAPMEFASDISIGDEGANLFDSVTVSIRDDEPLPTQPPLPLEAIIGIAVGGVVVLFLMVAILILICCICHLRSVKRQGFYTTYEDQSKEPPTMLRYSASLRSISSQTVVPVANAQGTVAKENEFYV